MSSTKVFFNFIAIVTSLGMITWMILDYFGGMIIYLLGYFWIIIPLLLLYIFSFFQTLFSIVKNGFKYNIVKIVFLSSVGLYVIGWNIYESELLKSKIVLSAIMNDDLYSYSLIFRENGLVEYEINGFLGFTENFKASYIRVGDTIVFSKIPSNNSFLPKKILIDSTQNALFTTTDSTGKFQTKKEWLNHFVIINP